jgi:hypothetical protein
VKSRSLLTLLLLFSAPALAAGADVDRCRVLFRDSLQGLLEHRRTLEKADTDFRHLYDLQISRYPHHRARVMASREALNEAARTGSRQVEVLRQLGVEVRATQGRYAAVTMPPLKTFIDRYNRLMRASAAKVGEAIYPGQAYLNPEGRLVAMDFLAPKPEGFTRVDMHMMKDDHIVQMIDQGYFPFTLDRFGHDLAHFTGFLEFPSYRAAFKRYVRALATRLPLSERDYVVFGYVLEAMEVVPSTAQGALRRILSDTFREATPRTHATAAQVLSRLRSLDDSAVLEQARKVVREGRPLVSQFGGGSRELVGFYGDYFQTGSLDHHFGQLAGALKERAPDIEKIRSDLAILEVALWESSQLTAETFIEELSKGTLPETSPAHHFICRSGTFERVSELDSRALTRVSLRAALCPGT